MNETMIQYIIFGKNYYQYNGFDTNRYIYHDAISQQNVLYIEPKDTFWDHYIRFFFRNEYGIAFRKKLFIPFRKIAFRALLRHVKRIKKTGHNVFVFFYTEPWFFDKKGFLSYIRESFGDVKLVYHITNIIQNIQIGPAYLQKYFDLVSTCNRGDSERYRLPFFPNACSYIPFPDNQESNSDCLFVGQAKERLKDLLTVYEILAQKGVRCEFFISGVNEKDQRFGDTIHYNQVLDYDVVLKKVEKTNVLLELLQAGMDSHTLRYPEAVNYGKKLLTNNRSVITEKSYSPQNIRIIQNADDVAAIDVSFFKTPIAEDYPCRESVSSRSFLTFIQNNLGL